ncbi:Flagellar assembly factor FliW [Candidatus Magnetoovum chiemensis]|nr:Flagellar assembly factor FliW [Candidatus Magnetoovum chiemensis]
MKINTTRFDEIEIDEDKIITFPRAIAGFENLRRYFLLAHKDPVKWLHSVEDPDVAFLVVEPFGIIEEYSFKLVDEIEAFLELSSIDNALVLVILSVTNNKLTANLRLPLIINTDNLVGVQLILDDNRVPIDYHVCVPAGAM